MRSVGKLTMTAPNEREILVQRSFDAPRQLVFECHTKPELVKQWLFGPEEWPMVECSIDLRVGGRLRYVWRNSERGDMAMSGTYREVAAPARLVNTELFDEDWTEGEALVTTEFIEHDARTLVKTTVLYSSKQARDGALKTPMLEGWEQGYARLDVFAQTSAARA